MASSWASGRKFKLPQKIDDKMLRVGHFCLATGRQRPILASYCCL